MSVHDSALITDFLWCLAVNDFSLSVSSFGFHYLCLRPYKIICEIMLISMAILKSYKQRRKINEYGRTNMMISVTKK